MPFDGFFIYDNWILITDINEPKNRNISGSKGHIWQMLRMLIPLYKHNFDLLSKYNQFLQRF